MTANQINYWNMRETGRHNVATEVETNRHNVVTETETERHNRAGEQFNLATLNETIRHNKAGENLQGQQLSETVRHNLAGEAVNLGNLQLSKDTLTESTRHNQANEYLASQNVDLARLTQQETARHNLSTEGISRSQIGLGYAQLSKDLQYLALESEKLEETKRHNLNTEATNWSSAVARQEVDRSTAQLNSTVAALNAAKLTLTDQQVAKIQADIDLAYQQLELAKKGAKYENFAKATKGIESLLNSISTVFKGYKSYETFLSE